MTNPPFSPDNPFAKDSAQSFSPDNPFAQQGQETQSQGYSTENPFVVQDQGVQATLDQTAQRNLEAIRQARELRDNPTTTPEHKARLQKIISGATQEQADLENQPKEGIAKQFALTGAEEAANIFGGVARGIAKLGKALPESTPFVGKALNEAAPYLDKTAEKLRDFAATVAPSDISGSAPGSTAARVLGSTAGQLAAFSPIQTGASSLAAPAASALAKTVAPRLVSRALEGIATAAESAVERFGPKVGGVLGRSLEAAPGQVLGAVAGQTAVNSDSMKSWDGWATAGAFGLLGALSEGVAGTARGEPLRGRPATPTPTTEPPSGQPAVTEPAATTGTTEATPKPEEPAAMATDISKPIQQLTPRDVFNATPDEVRQLATRATKEEKETLFSLFGSKGAKAWKSADRIASSPESLPQDANAALERMQTMRGKLSEANQQVLDNLGKQNFTAARLRAIAKKASDYSPDNLAKVATPDLMNQFAQLIGDGRVGKSLTQTYALQRVFNELTARGVDPKTELLPQAVRYTTEQLGVKPNDAARMIAQNIVNVQQLVDPTKVVQVPEPMPLADDAKAASIREDVGQQLQATGRYTPEQVSAHQALYENIFNSLGERTGIDPLELYNRYRLRIFASDAAPKAGGDGLDQTAYHGSPHQFDRFSLQKMGSGEGSQAFGWGLYFASNREIAQYYRDALTPDNGSVKYKGTEVSDLTAPSSKTLDQYTEAEIKAEALERLYYHIGPPKTRLQRTIEALQADIDSTNHWLGTIEKALKGESVDIRPSEREQLLRQKEFNERYIRWNTRAIEILKSIDPKDLEFKTSGRVYHVEIPEPDTMLDWDKVIKPDSKEAELLHKDSTIGELYDKYKGMGMEGKSLYYLLRNYIEEHPEAIPADVRKESRLDEIIAYRNSLSEARGTGNRMTIEQKAPELASRWLAKLGFTGIKYLDGASRKTGEGSYNFVVFDDNLVHIRDYEQAKAGESLGRITLGKQNVSIQLFKNANLSTFLHESGHFFYQVMQDLSTGKDAVPELQRDFATLTSWMREGSRSERAGMEKFARGFESYLGTGKAPKPELQGIFDTFKDWILGVYKSLKNLNVELTPEVTKVFDRLVGGPNVEARSELAAQSAKAQAELAKIINGTPLKSMPPEQVQKIEALKAQIESLNNQLGSSLDQTSLPDPPPEQDPATAQVENTQYDFTDPLERKVNLGSLPEYSKNIQGQLFLDDKKPERLSGTETLSMIYQQIVRGIHGVEKAQKLFTQGKAVPAVKDAGKLAQLAAGSAGREEQFLLNRPFVLDDEGNIQMLPNVPSLRETLKPLRGKLNDFRRYVVARRVLELNQDGRQVVTGIDVADATQEVSNQTDPAIAQAAENLTAYLGAVKMYAQRWGLLSEASSQAMDFLGRSYISLSRAFESTKPKFGKTQYSDIAKPGQLRALEGSRLKIVDPIVSSVEYTRHLIRASDLNAARSVLVDWAEAQPEIAQGVMRRVKDISVNASPEVSDAARNLIEHAKALGVVIEPQAARELAATFSEAGMKMKGNVMPVWRKGELQMWEVDPLIADSIRSMSPSEINWFVRLFGLPAQVLKVGITGNPVFGSIQSMVALWQGALQSKYGYRPTDSFVGLWNRVIKSKSYQEFKAGGGAFSGLSSQDVRSTEAAIRHVTPMSAAQRVAMRATHPVEALRDMTAPLEEAARLGAFIRARGAGATSLDAALEARNLDTDFSLRGSSPVIQALSHMTAFLNPFIQSTDLLLKTAARHPMRTALIGFSSISLPSIYLWVASRDDKEVRDLQTGPGGSIYWYARGPSGTIYQIHKPYGWGQLFGNTAEYAMSQMENQDPDAARHLQDALAEQATFLVIPNIVQDWMALKFNQNLFTGAPIVPDRLMQTDAGLTQSNVYTSQFSKDVGAKLGISPMKLDFAIRQLTGTMGDEGLKLADKVGGTDSTKPTPVKADLPLIGRFFARYPTLNAGPVRDFYYNANKSQEALKTLQLMGQQGRVEEFQSYLADKQVLIGLAPVYGATRAQIAKIRAALEQVNQLPGDVLSGEDKRELNDYLLRQIIEITRNVNLAANTIKANATPASAK